MTNNETTNLIERTIESSFEFLNNFSIRQLKKKNRLFLFSKIIFPSWFPKKINKVTKIWEISDNVAKRFRLARIYYSLDIVGLKKKKKYQNSRWMHCGRYQLRNFVIYLRQVHRAFIVGTHTRAIWLRMTAVPPITAFESVNDYNIFMQSSCQIYRAVSSNTQKNLHDNFQRTNLFYSI